MSALPTLVRKVIRVDGTTHTIRGDVVIVPDADFGGLV
jgi:hypothetical protein